MLPLLGRRGCRGGEVVRRRHVQRSVFEVLLPDGDKLWDPVLRRIDEVLDDEELVELVAEALERRRPNSRRKGRPGTPAEVVLRMLILKHLYDWSFDECEREVRGSLVYRGFCRIDCEKVPDAKTLIRLSQALGGDVLKKILERIVGIAGKRKVVRGRVLRVDTTVVETNIHYPTDSGLLADGVRVLTRGLKKLRDKFGKTVIRMRDRTRAMGRRAFQLAQRQRTEDAEQKKAQLQKLYGGALRIAAAVVGEAKKAVAAVKGRARGATAVVVQEIEKTVELVRRVQAQTRARVFKGDTHYPGKVLSLFEPATEAIRKGKASKPTEFGKLVKIQEAEGHIVTDYEVCATRVPDQKLWEPSLKRHQELLGKPPHLATADAGFASAANEKIAKELGVKRVVLPTATRNPKQKPRQRWFRRALRWRTGCEARISVLKRRYGLRRCRYRGMPGLERCVGLGVIASNLWVLGRAKA
jgi:transposase, IS5 family